MRTELFDYELPESRVAQRPTPERDGARLLALEPGGGHAHRRVTELPGLIPEGALVVVNDTRVRKARLLGRRGSGGRVEIFLLAAAGWDGAGRMLWDALGRANKPLRPGTQLEVGALRVEIIERRADGFLRVAIAAEGDVEARIEEVGHVPLPPYVRRPDEREDEARYQTVYARELGSVAAPTAGLHLSEALLAALEARRIEVGRLTLQVGLGTFRPVACDDLDDHPMHAERICVSAALREQVHQARLRRKPVVGIGTTVVRALESAADPDRPGEVCPTDRETELLIQPGYRFQVVDALLTNFHMPKSTLLALVAAFAGRERILAAYAEALREGYRFLSYGDAMWLPERLP